MITMTVQSPEQLWVALGAIFFNKKRPTTVIDYSIASRRFFSFNNVLTVTEWPKYWENPLLYDIVGYSERGSKMNTLRQTYLNEEAWKGFKAALDEYGVKERRVGIKTFGVNFNLKPMGKGGCLSSFHLIQHDQEIDIVVHLKVAELPRKFAADLVFIGQLISELDLIQGEYKVTFMLSTLYFSIIGLRAYVPILGRKFMNYQGLPIEDPRNYQVGVQEGIGKARDRLMTKFGIQILENGLGMEPWEVIKKGRI